MKKLLWMFELSTWSRIEWIRWMIIKKRVALYANLTSGYIGDVCSIIWQWGSVTILILWQNREFLVFLFWSFKFCVHFTSIPATPLYGMYIFLRYYNARVSPKDFLHRELFLTRKLLNQRFLVIKLKWFPTT